MFTKLQEQEAELRRQGEGDPAGTHFAVIVLVALLVMVGVYFVTAHAKDVASSPVIGHSVTQITPTDAR